MKWCLSSLALLSLATPPVMSQPIPAAQADAVFVDAAVPVAAFQAIPPQVAPSPYAAKPQNPELVALKQKYQQQIEKIRDEKDGDERERQTKKLADIMDAMFAVDLEDRQAEIDQREAKLKQLRDAYEERKTRREKIVTTKIEQILQAVDKEALQPKVAAQRIRNRQQPNDLFAMPKPKTVTTKLQIISDETEDGVRKMQVRARYLKTETRSREIMFAVMVEQTRTRTVNGEEEEYTVQVPEQRSKTQTYSVQVPVSTVLKLEVPDGEDWEKLARKRVEEKSR